MVNVKDHYLYPGAIFVANEPYLVTTILGSCVAVCLWDPVLRIGGINHYKVPFWNGIGLASPKYGNIAIEKLIEKMLKMGCQKKDLKAKIFGGAAVIENSSNILSIGKRNIIVAKDMLEQQQIPIISSDVNGKKGRKIKFYTETGVVMVKTIKRWIIYNSDSSEFCKITNLVIPSPDSSGRC